MSSTSPVIFGEVLFDHFPDGSRVLGGAPFNVAWHLQALGLRPRLISAVGADESGREAMVRMADWGLVTGGVQVDPLHPTGRVMATLVDGDPAFEIGTEQAYDFIDPVGAALAVARDSAGLVYHGTLALRSDRSWEALRTVLRETGAPSFVDLNLRDPWWTPDRLRWCLDNGTWIKLNEKELETVTGKTCPDADACGEAASGLRARYELEAVLVTRGDEGALGVFGDDVHAAEAAPLDASERVDTVGAGDAFSAAAIVGLTEAWTPDALLRRGNGFARDLCRIRGATTEDASLYGRNRERWDEE